MEEFMNRQEAVRRATELVEQMSVEELASQLRFDADEIPHLDIPEYNWWNEALHGVARAGTATVFPQAIGLGATFDEELLERIGVAVSTEARAKYNENEKHEDRDIYKGITLWSPNVNLFRDPRWGRGHETYGEDPTLIAILGVAYIKGLQGEGEYLRTAACAKHFAVHSGPEEKRHYFDAKVSMKELWETYLPQFEACVREGKVEAVMGAYNRTNGEPCCAHSYLMVEVLRKQWGFQGHYVSDCWAIRDFHEHHKVTDRPEESVRLALEMGCDVNCGCTYQKILNAYEEGLISKELLQKSAIRLFTTRFLLGMFDETEYDNIPYEVVECREHIELSIEAACKSVVLLKNDGILPLNKKKLKEILPIFIEHHTSYMIFTTNGFYSTLEPDYVRDRFAYRGSVRFGNKMEDFLPGGPMSDSPACQIQQFDSIDEFIERDLEVIKVEAFSHDETEIQKVIPYFKDMKEIAYLSSYPDNVEITNENAQKGLILEKVIDLLNIKKEEVIVLGDGMNDITLFERFPYSFAPNNAEKVIQEKAYKVVSSCKDGAVSEAIEYALENL